MWANIGKDSHASVDHGEHIAVLSKKLHETQEDAVKHQENFWSAQQAFQEEFKTQEERWQKIHEESKEKLKGVTDAMSEVMKHGVVDQGKFNERIDNVKKEFERQIVSLGLRVAHKHDELGDTLVKIHEMHKNLTSDVEMMEQDLFDRIEEVRRHVPPAVHTTVTNVVRPPSIPLYVALALSSIATVFSALSAFHLLP